MDKREPFWKRGLNVIRGRPARPKERITRPKGSMVEEVKDTKRRLEGQEFDIVNEGLDEKQVTKFVTDLMSKYRALAEQQRHLLEQQEHILSLGTLSEKAVMEADKVSADIKARAKRGAEAEAASIIAKANQRAREMLAEGKRSAQEASQNEVESILLAAQRKAAIIEIEAKQRAQLFFIRSREAVEGELSEEVKKAYNRLLSALQDLLGEGHDIEADWTGKTTGLRERETFELAMPSSALATEIAQTSPLVAVAGKAEIGIPEKEEVVSEVSPVEAVARIEAVVPEVEAVAEERPREEVKPKSVPLEPPTIYEGELELALIPPMDLAVMSEIYSRLGAISEVKILRTVGSWAKGTTITVLLEKPLPLVDMLTKIPTVELASELPGKQGFLKKTADALGAGSKEKGMSRITLKMHHS